MQTFKDYFLITEKKDNTVYYISQFLPPTLEDWKNLDYLNKKYEKVIVYISNPKVKKREINGQEFTPNDSKKILDIYNKYISNSNIDIQISQAPSPVQAILHDMEYTKTKDVLIFTSSRTQEDWKYVQDDIKQKYDKKVIINKLNKFPSKSSFSTNFSKKDNEIINSLISEK